MDLTEDGVGGVHCHLVLGGISDQALSVRESNVRRGGSVTLVVGDDFDLSMLENADARVGRAEINSYCWSFGGHVSAKKKLVEFYVLKKQMSLGCCQALSAGNKFNGINRLLNYASVKKGTNTNKASDVLECSLSVFKSIARNKGEVSYRGNCLRSLETGDSTMKLNKEASRLSTWKFRELSEKNL